MIDQIPDFDMVIGQLDYILSKLMIYSKQAKEGTLAEANRQTLKHHIEDMEAACAKIRERLGLQEGTPQPGWAMAIGPPQLQKSTPFRASIAADCFPIPDDYERVADGEVRIGDQVWGGETGRFIEVTGAVLNHLGFLDARSVSECSCVIRKKPVGGGHVST